MIQILQFDKPIPSCFIHDVEFVNGKMVYNYLIDTEVELTNNMEEQLVIYNQISYLRLVHKDSIPNISANIPISSLDEYRSYLELQREADIKLRSKFRSENPDLVPRTIVLENRNYSREELKKLDVEYIMEIIAETEDMIEVTCYG